MCSTCARNGAVKGDEVGRDHKHTFLRKTVGINNFFFSHVAAILEEVKVALDLRYVVKC